MLDIVSVVLQSDFSGVEMTEWVDILLTYDFDAMLELVFWIVKISMGTGLVISISVWGVFQAISLFSNIVERG